MQTRFNPSEEFERYAIIADYFLEDPEALNERNRQYLKNIFYRISRETRSADLPERTRRLRTGLLRFFGITSEAINQTKGAII